MIERVRFLTDLRSLSREVMDKGHVYVGATRAEMFLKHTRKITATPDEIPDNEIKENYNKMITILDNNSLIIKSIKEDLEDIKENYL